MSQHPERRCDQSVAADGRALVLDGVFFSVPELKILQGVYLAVRPASVCVLFGRNGCGKTTLIKVGAAQIQPDSGLVIVDGERYHSRRQKKRYDRMAYLPQDSMLPGDVTVRRMLSFVKGATALLDDELITRFLDQRIESLSVGQRRYLEIRLVLALGRDYVLLDEPFTGAEPILISRISELIRQAADAGAGILLTDHYHHYTVPLADDAYLMRSKQCRRLNPDAGVREQLEDLGYLTSR